MKVEQVIYDNYMPYAEGVIKERAVPDIAGLKPVQTRILHAMYREKLFDKRRKAAGIVGETMKCHPNGDAAIYDAMVRLVDSHEGLMCPLIKGKGNYGKSYSRDLAYAASRYPEASLMPIAKEFFDGLEDNAVDMVPNYDGTLKEPKVLPVKFPNVLVNTSSGIAVGVASQIPSFSLRDVCKATIGVIRGEIETAEELADVLGYPDFPTGGFIHEDEGELVKLMRTGRGTFNVSGGTDLYSNAIIIKGVPFGTNIENVIEGIKANLKTELKEIDRVTDLTDINGLHIEIHLKGGADPRKVVKKLRSLTKLTMKMSFNTAVIINGEYRQLGIFELINEWVSFRAGCIQRVYQKRHGDLAEREHKLSAFEKIAGRLDEADAIMKRQESEVVELLKSTFDMDDVQAEYLGDCKRKEFYADRVMKRLEELKKLRETMAEYLKLATDDNARLGLICDELVEISEKYGEDRRTGLEEPFVEVREAEESEPDTSPAVFVMTKGCKVIKLDSTKALTTFEEDPNDPVAWRVASNNSGTILLFSDSGVCYKLSMCDVPSHGRNVRYENLYNLIQRQDDSKIVLVDDAGDYKGKFNVVYGQGNGVRVYYKAVSGNRKVYRGLFDSSKQHFVFTEDRFFIITRNRKAAYADISIGTSLGARAFKVTRIDKGDSIFGIQPLSAVPDSETWGPERLYRYTNGYTVKIKDDKLW